MQAPKKRTSSSKRDMRRSHHHLTPIYSIACSNCGDLVLRYCVCSSCGFYRGKKRQIPSVRRQEKQERANTSN